MTYNYLADSEMNNLLQMTDMFLMKVKQQVQVVTQ
jgi:hypothetical protein